MKSIHLWGSGLLAVLISLSIGAGAVGVQAASLPAGVPSQTAKATVTGFVDGDTFKVDLDGEGQTISLAGIDAPNEGECFATESADRIRTLIPRNSVIYLQDAGVDVNGGTLERFVWVPGADGEKAFLLNTKLVRDGYAGYDDSLPLSKYGERLSNGQQEAQKRASGLWQSCGGVHEDMPAASTTAQSAYTKEEVTYARRVADISSSFAASMDNFSTLMTLASVDPTYYADPQWQTMVENELDVWQSCYDDALALTPPESLATMHEYLVESLKTYSEAADDISLGIENGDMTSLETGNQLIDEATATMQLATAEFNQFLSLH